MLIGLTVVNLLDSVGHSGNRGRTRVEALEPVPHGRLGVAVIPNDI